MKDRKVKKYDISIIVPVYNVSSYLNECITSILGQNLENVEYIFVDDCSDDGGFDDLIRLIEISYSFLSVSFIRHSKNRGVSSTRNTGLMHAQGDYIIFIDADDILDRNMLSKLLIKARICQSDIVCCDFYNVYNKSQLKVIQKPYNSKEENIKALLTGKLTGALWNKLIDRNLFINHDIKFPDGLNMLEDLRVCVKLFYYAENIAYVEEALYYYHKNRVGSITRSDTFKYNYINYERLINTQKIEEFLMQKGLFVYKHEINILKLMSKKSLLITAKDIAALKKWKAIFPESNQTMESSHFPKRYKYIVRQITSERWFIPFLWIQFKKCKSFFK